MFSSNKFILYESPTDSSTCCSILHLVELGDHHLTQIYAVFCAGGSSAITWSNFILQLCMYIQ